MFPKLARIRSKTNIEQARQDRCEYCYRVAPVHVHHIRSRGSGGHDEPENLVSLCIHCHDKAHKALIPRDVLREIARERESL